MWVAVSYFIIIIFANSLGAISGMGGGVIIKPMFDLIHAHDLSSISFYSSVAVLTMSITTIIRQMKGGLTINWKKAIQISLGAIGGGWLGNILLDRLLLYFPQDKKVQTIQIILMIVTLLFSFWYSIQHRQYFCFDIEWIRIFSGLILGCLASFLGIGGGPINVAFLMFFLGTPIKDATAYSIVIIFFSQLAKILNILGKGQLFKFDLTMLSIVIPAAIIGGIIGAQFSRQVSDKIVSVVYRWVIIFVLAVNLYNLIVL